MGFDLGVGNPIGSQGPIAGLLGYAGSGVRIGARVGENLAFSCEEPAIAHDSGFKRHASRVTRDRLKAFADRQHELYRSARLPREGRCDGFTLYVKFAAITAADVRNDDANAA